MKVGVMQPYFFPYIGYWQLINAVDVFVLFDDVNYIKQGWVHRNRIMHDGKVRYFNVPVKEASQNKKINEICVNQDKAFFERDIRILHDAYRKAEYYKETIELIKPLLLSDIISLSDYLGNIIRCTAEYLEIDTKILASSSIHKDDQHKGQQRIIDICKALGADEYINPIGGMNLYDRKVFEKEGIRLSFLERDESICYEQFTNEFIADLSIIDMLMFCGKLRTMEFLSNYNLR